MSDQVNFIVPVAPFEPKEIIERSVKALIGAESPEMYEKEIFYVIDTDKKPAEDERIQYLRQETPEEVKTISRTSNKGRRAGAINKALEEMSIPEYVAIFDIDSRPGEKFVKACIGQLEEEEKFFMSTCPRKIINGDQNFVTKMVEAEYDYLTDMQLLMDKTKSFNHFNGLISVIDGDYLEEEKLNESRMCEDTDFTQRAYLNGKRPAINTESYLGEQAVTSLSDLYSQQVRWMNGALEGVIHFSKPFLRSNLPVKVKLSWLSVMVLPFFAAVLSPLALIHTAKNIFVTGEVLNSVEKGFALFCFAWFVSYCGAVNLFNLLLDREVEWTNSDREII